MGYYKTTRTTLYCNHAGCNAVISLITGSPMETREEAHWTYAWTTVKKNGKDVDYCDKHSPGVDASAQDKKGSGATSEGEANEDVELQPEVGGKLP